MALSEFSMARAYSACAAASACDGVESPVVNATACQQTNTTKAIAHQRFPKIRRDVKGHMAVSLSA